MSTANDHDEVEDQQPDRQAPTIGSRLLGLLSFSFVDLAGEVLDLSLIWRNTRRWKSILLIVPIVILVVTIGTLTAIGKLSDRGDKIMWYVDRAEKEIKIASGEKEEDDKGDKSSSKQEPSEKPVEPLTDEQLKVKTDFIDLLYRRVLQIEKDNKFALYYTASQMERFGKTSSARPIMESLAPEKLDGFDLAHAWLARDMIQRVRNGEPINREALKHHLKHGTTRKGILPALLIVYAQLLQQDEQWSEAEPIVNRAAEFEPGLLLNSISSYMQRELRVQAAATTERLVELLKPRFDGEKGEEAMLAAANAYILNERFQDAIQLLRNGVIKRPGSNILRRGLSDACRIKFVRTFKADGTNVNVDLEILNFAMVADPTNLAVQNELHMLTASGIGQNEDNMEKLRAQIAMHGTSFASRMIIAEAAYRKGDFNSAVNQYEVVLAEIPNMTLVLNNLAMLYTMLKPPKHEEALKHIDRAIAISPAVGEFYDTRGEVLNAMDRKKEAIETYKLALEKNRDQVKTREKLIALYEQTGAESEANAERKTLEEVKAVLQEREKARKQAEAQRQAANRSQDQKQTKEENVTTVPEPIVPPLNSPDQPSPKAEDK